MRGPLTELARAKVNLTLHAIGVRADGYHNIESLVIFARQADRLTLAPGLALELAVHGPYAAACGANADNLVLKAARTLAGAVDGLRLGRFRLTKNLPVAAGLGGGSADAAAVLRLLARANRLKRDDPRLYAAARASGADVTVCLEQRARVMRGIGDLLSAPIALPKLYAVLVNAGSPLATKDVFNALRRRPEVRANGAPQKEAAERRSSAFEARAARSRLKTTDLVSAVAEERNDLEATAISLQPAIAEVLAALRARPDCLLARMSGAGATCFGLFPTARAATTAARSIRARHPSWWVRADTLGG